MRIVIIIIIIKILIKEIRVRITKIIIEREIFVKNFIKKINIKWNLIIRIIELNIK